MSIILKSLRQMLRTPVRTALFSVLIMLSAALLTLGGGLYLLCNENIKRFEEVFSTIATVQQKPSSEIPRVEWDTVEDAYISRGTQPVYDQIISADVLDFEDAGYIHAPQKMPYYGAYSPDWNAHRDDWTISLMAQWRAGFSVFEVTPLEDCVPDHPVRMQITRELYGFRQGAVMDYYGYILFCDHYNPNPAPMYAGKTYVMALVEQHEHPEFDISTWEKVPYTEGTTYAISSTQYTPDGSIIPDPFTMETPWDEITEGFYDTTRGKRWLEFAEAMSKSEQTIPVVPTNATELLMSFYNGNSNITDGRDISEEEYTSGKLVCLITREFAELNELVVGDALTLPLYYANYSHSAGLDFSPGDQSLGVSVHLLNADGKQYEVFEENTYEIVGIYNEINKVSYSNGYDMPASAVVVPAASIKNSAANNILAYGPMKGYNTVFQIPNGTIEKYTQLWEAQGIDELELTFYDRGYTQLKAGLDEINGTALALFFSGIFITLLILLFFCQLFIGKQKKRTAIERSLGMTKTMCTLSLLSGLLLITLLGAVCGSALGYSLTGTAMNRFVGNMNDEVFDTTYSSWTNASDTTEDTQFDTSSVSSTACAILAMFVVVMAAGIALLQIRNNLKSEPLKLLSMREN